MPTVAVGAMLTPLSPLEPHSPRFAPRASLTLRNLAGPRFPHAGSACRVPGAHRADSLGRPSESDLRFRHGLGHGLSSKTSAERPVGQPLPVIGMLAVAVPTVVTRGLRRRVSTIRTFPLPLSTSSSIYFFFYLLLLLSTSSSIYFFSI